MLRINFSHAYPKLHGQIAAKLLYVEVHDRKELNAEFVEYDTVYTIKDAIGPFDDEIRGHYQLPSGKLIILVFLGDKLIPFTTVRRWTPLRKGEALTKEDYYRSHIGELFNINFTKEEQNMTLRKQYEKETGMKYRCPKWRTCKINKGC